MPRSRRAGASYACNAKKKERRGFEHNGKSLFLPRRSMQRDTGIGHRKVSILVSHNHRRHTHTHTRRTTTPPSSPFLSRLVETRQSEETLTCTHTPPPLLKNMDFLHTLAKKRSLSRRRSQQVEHGHKTLNVDEEDTTTETTSPRGGGYLFGDITREYVIVRFR